MALVIPLAELRSPLEKSYRNTYYCAGVLEQHNDGRITAKYCNNRWCLVCLRVRTGRAINAYEPSLLAWQNPQFVTLTLPTVPGDSLRERIDYLIRQPAYIARCIRRTDGLPFKALRKLECTYRLQTGLFHPHLHLIVEGIDAAGRLQDRWLERHPEASPKAQDIRPCDAHQLRELFKYFTKLSTASEDGPPTRIPPRALDVIFQSMRKRRVYQPMGFTRPTSCVDEEAPVGADDVTYAWTRLGSYVRWQWSQDAHDWLDRTTGELLTTVLSRPLLTDQS